MTTPKFLEGFKDFKKVGSQRIPRESVKTEKQLRKLAPTLKGRYMGVAQNRRGNISYFLRFEGGDEATFAWGALRGFGVEGKEQIGGPREFKWIIFPDTRNNRTSIDVMANNPRYGGPKSR